MDVKTEFCHVCARVCMCTSVHVEPSRQPQLSFIRNDPSCFWDEVFHLLGSLQSARLADQGTPEICLSLPQQIQCYKDTATCLEFYMSFYSGSHDWIGGTLLPESCPCVPQFTFPLLRWEEGLRPLRINIPELWAEILLTTRHTTWWHRVKVTNCKTKSPQGHSLDNCFELGLPASWTVWNKSLLLQRPNLGDFALIPWYV